MTDTPPPALVINRSAVVSLVAGLLACLSFCIAIAPIPLTEWVCLPSAALLGLVGLVAGFVSLVQIRLRNENGRLYALIGIWVGGLTLLVCACALTVGILLLPKIVALIRHVGILLLSKIVTLIRHLLHR